LRWFGFADCELTSRGRDGGVDVRGTHVLAQVKAESVPTPAERIRELSGIAAHEGRTAVFFSWGGYTSQAVKEAAAMGVALFAIDHAGQVSALNGHASALERQHKMFPSGVESVVLDTTDHGLERLGDWWSEEGQPAVLSALQRERPFGTVALGDGDNLIGFAQDTRGRRVAFVAGRRSGDESHGLVQLAADTAEVVSGHFHAWLFDELEQAMSVLEDGFLVAIGPIIGATQAADTVNTSVSTILAAWEAHVAEPRAVDASFRLIRPASNHRVITAPPPEAGRHRCRETDRPSSQPLWERRWTWADTEIRVVPSDSSKGDWWNGLAVASFRSATNREVWRIAQVLGGNEACGDILVSIDSGELISAWWLETGEPAWQSDLLLDLADEDEYSTLVTELGVFVFHDSTLHALDPMTGEERWCVQDEQRHAQEVRALAQTDDETPKIRLHTRDGWWVDFDALTGVQAGALRTL
jgi:hypothetical protein